MVCSVNFPQYVCTGYCQSWILSLSLFLYYELLVCYTVLVTALLGSISNAVMVTALLESISHLCLLTLFIDSNLQTQWTIKIKFTPLRSPLKSTQMHFKTT